METSQHSVVLPGRSYPSRYSNDIALSAHNWPWTEEDMDRMLPQALQTIEDGEMLEDMDMFVEEGSNNVACDIYSQEAQTPNNGPANSSMEEFMMASTPQAELGRPVEQDYNHDLHSLLSIGGETSVTAADLERTISPMHDEISPRTMTAMVSSLTSELQRTNVPMVQESTSCPLDEITPQTMALVESLTSPLQQPQCSYSADPTTGNFREYSSCNSIAAPCVLSHEAQGEQLQLAGNKNTLSPVVAKPAPQFTTQPTVVTSPIHCSDVEQVVSLNGEVVVMFHSQTASMACQEIYSALVHTVPEMIKPESKTKESMKFNIPHDAMLLTEWCSCNRSGMIRASIGQKLSRVYAELHHNAVTKGRLCFFGSLTFSDSVYVSVTPEGEPQLHLLFNFPNFWNFAKSAVPDDPSTPRRGRLMDVIEFSKTVDYTLLQPAYQGDFLVSKAVLSACEYCVKEGTEGDKMPLFCKRLAGHKLCRVQLMDGPHSYEIIAFTHEMIESTLGNVGIWRVVRPYTKLHSDTVVYGLYAGTRMVLCSEELASAHFMVKMRRLSVKKIKQFTGHPVLLAMTGK